MSVREVRACDVCEKENAGQPGWLVMHAINAPEQMGDVVYDICSFDCLKRFVTGEDGEDEAPEMPQEPVADKVTLEEAEAAFQNVQEAMNGTPRMTLAQALAMGLKPGYDPLRDGPR